MRVEVYTFSQNSECTFNSTPCRWMVPSESIRPVVGGAPDNWNMQLIISGAASSTTHDMHLYRDALGWHATLDGRGLEPGASEQETATTRQRELAEQRRQLECAIESLEARRRVAAADEQLIAARYGGLLSMETAWADPSPGDEVCAHRGLCTDARRPSPPELQERWAAECTDAREFVGTYWPVLVNKVGEVEDALIVELNTLGLERRIEGISNGFRVEYPTTISWARSQLRPGVGAQLVRILAVEEQVTWCLVDSEDSLPPMEERAPENLVGMVHARMLVHRALQPRFGAVREVLSALRDLADVVVRYCSISSDLANLRPLAQHPDQGVRQDATRRITNLNATAAAIEQLFSQIGQPIGECSSQPSADSVLTRW